MSGSRLFALGSAAFFVIAPASPANGQGEADSKSFVASYREGARKLEAASRNVRCHTFFELVPIGLFKGWTCHRDVLANPTARYSIDRFDPGSGARGGESFVFCLAKDYYFTLNRATPTGPYKLTGFSRDSSVLNDRGLIAARLSTTRAAYEIDAISIDRLISHPSFKMKGFTVADPGKSNVDPGRVVIDFECDDHEHSIVGGRMAFSRDLDWSLMDYDVRISGDREGPTKGMPQGVRLEGTVKCKRWPGGFVFPEQAEYRFRYPTEPHGPEQLKRFRVTDVDFSEVPDSEFKPSAFGIPDSILAPPGGSRTSPVRLYLVASIGCFLFAIVLRRYLQRRQPDQAL